MLKRFTKISLGAFIALIAWNCSDDSSGTKPPVSNTCDIEFIASQFPVWTGAYFIFPDNSVTDSTKVIGSFDRATGNINNADGIVIATIDISALPYFDGTNLIDKNCTITNINGDTLGVVGGDTTEVLPASSSAGMVVTPIVTPGGDTTLVPGDTILPSLSSSSVAGDTIITESSSSLSGSGVMDPNGYEVMNYATILGNGKTGWSSRYWDACKPHCSWPGNVDTSSQAAYEAMHYTARNCNINDYEIPAYTLSKNVQQYWVGFAGTNSACENSNRGGAFTCTDMAPVAVNDTLAYGFVAGPGSMTTCGKCFHLQFNGENHDNQIKATHKALKGKHMIVMTSNIGHDVQNGQFDLMVPGGGVGIYDALSSQIGVASSELGAQYGGLLSACQQTLGYDNTVAKYQECIISKCDALFTKHENLLRGCKWFAEWYMAADNPTYNWE